LKIRSNKNVERATVINVELKETEGGEIKWVLKDLKMT
jgi:hypothetical protein